MNIPKWWWLPAWKRAWLVAYSLETGKTYRACVHCRFHELNFSSSGPNISVCRHPAVYETKVVFDAVSGSFRAEGGGNTHCATMRNPSMMSAATRCGPEARHWEPRTREQRIKRALRLFAAVLVFLFLSGALSKLVSWVVSG
jgi:hypothetical protein